MNSLIPLLVSAAGRRKGIGVLPLVEAIMRVHYFREFFLMHGLDIGVSGQSHFNLYVALWNCGIPSVQGFGNRVNNLRKNRGKADYDLAASISRAFAQDAVREAHDIIVEFQAELTIIGPNSIVTGARKFLQSSGRIPRTP